MAGVQSLPPGAELAVVGSGIGGLTAAWLLATRYRVTLFEQHARPGMGAFSVALDPTHPSQVIDIPTRVFCAGYYPQFMALLEHLQVDIEATDHAATYTNAQGQVLLEYRNLPLAGRSLSYLSARSLWRPGAWRLALASRRFLAQVRRDLQDPTVLAELAGLSFAEYLQRCAVPEACVRQVLLPSLCVICTCAPAAIREYPADLLVRYLGSGVMQQGVVRAEQGVNEVVQRLLGAVRLQAATPVRAIEPVAEGVRVHTAQGEPQDFAGVVLAAQAQQVAPMLPQKLEQRRWLEQVQWAASEMLVHTDPSYMRAGPSAPVVYRQPEADVAPEVTVDMRRAFPTYARLAPVYQTWNPQREPAPDTQLARVGFTRPLVTAASRVAMARLRAAQGQERLWFCGAYVADKVPLLEAAVASALDACADLGVRPPWA